MVSHNLSLSLSQSTKQKMGPVWEVNLDSNHATADTEEGLPCAQCCSKPFPSIQESQKTRGSLWVQE